MTELSDWLVEQGHLVDRTNISEGVQVSVRTKPKNRFEKVARGLSRNTIRATNTDGCLHFRFAFAQAPLVAVVGVGGGLGTAVLGGAVARTLGGTRGRAAKIALIAAAANAMSSAAEAIAENALDKADISRRASEITDELIYSGRFGKPPPQDHPADSSANPNPR